MTAAVVQTLGIVNGTSSGSGSHMTITGNWSPGGAGYKPAAGSTIIVCVGGNSNGAGSISPTVTDNGHSYTSVHSVTAENNGNRWSAIFYRDNIAGGETINPDIALAFGNNYTAMAFEVTGLNTSGSLDQNGVLVPVSHFDAGPTADTPACSSANSVANGIMFSVYAGRTNAAWGAFATPKDNGVTCSGGVFQGPNADTWMVCTYHIYSATETSNCAWVSPSDGNVFTNYATATIGSFQQAGGGAASPLRFNSSLSGLGASGPFFHDRLASFRMAA